MYTGRMGATLEDVAASCREAVFGERQLAGVLGVITEFVGGDKAILLMEAHPSMIKRPIVDIDGELIVGYDSTAYETLLGL